MKIYSIQILNESKNQIGTSILTASKEWAKELKETWEKELKQNESKSKVTIWEYEVKTQGKNFGLYAFAQLFKE